MLQLPSWKPEGLIQAVNKPLQKLYKLKYMLKTKSKQVSTLQKCTWFVNERLCKIKLFLCLMTCQMAVIMKQSRGIYVSISTTASYFANRTHEATSSETMTSQYHCGAIINMNRYCRGVSGEIAATDDEDLQVNIRLTIIQNNGQYLLMLRPSSNAVHPSPCTLQVSTVHKTYYMHSPIIGYIHALQPFRRSVS